jgi:hypothetical protein
VKADLARLLRDALEKEADRRPFVVFLDMNLPPGQDRSFEEWVPKLDEEVLAWRGEASADNPDPYGAVVLTNFSLHGHGEAPSEGGERFLVLPFYAAVSLPGEETDRIWAAVEQYGTLPEGRAQEMTTERSRALISRAAAARGRCSAPVASARGARPRDRRPCRRSRSERTRLRSPRGNA